MDDEVAEQAAHWFLCNREGDLSAAQRIEFMAWMKRSPEHIRAYLHVLHVHRQVGEVMVAYGQEQGDRAALPELPATAKVVPLFAVPVPCRTPWSHRDHAGHSGGGWLRWPAACCWWPDWCRG